MAKNKNKKQLRFSPSGGAGSKGSVRNATGSSFVCLETEYHVAVQGQTDNRLFPLIRRLPENSRLPAPVIRRFSNCASSSRGKRSNRAVSWEIRLNLFETFQGAFSLLLAIKESLRPVPWCPEWRYLGKSTKQPGMTGPVFNTCVYQTTSVR